ncbi:MAG: tRNA (adenosine(37)-N6)-threonylcarbamoyltransferase complex ATPase subunit type 1 TsaE [Oligoflexales bacterium]
MTLLWQKTKAASALEELGTNILKELSDPFCLWLHGEPGAGKSTITRTLLYQLGLDRRMPVQSPTYTYINEYAVGDQIFAHMDLYRIGEDGFQDDLEWVLDRKFNGIFLEWPPNKSDDFIPPTHILKIDLANHGEQRKYHFYRS